MAALNRSSYRLQFAVDSYDAQRGLEHLHGFMDANRLSAHKPGPPPHSRGRMFRTAPQSVLLAHTSSSAHREPIGRTTSNAIASPTKLVAQCIFLASVRAVFA